MKRPLLTHLSFLDLYSEIKSWVWFNQLQSLTLKPIWAFMFVMFISTLSLTAQPSISFTSSCVCLDNASNLGAGNGQFQNDILITSVTGETWTVVVADGFYGLLSQPPPNAPDPIFPTTLITENGATGTYPISGLSVDGDAFTFSATNGIDTVSISGLCSYPDPVIQGDAFTCGDETLTYSVTNVPGNTYSWSLSGIGGSIVGPTTGSSVDILWSDVPGGPYILQIIETDPDGCEEIDALPISIEGVIAMACNNVVNVSLDNNCELEVLPDMILEDMQYDNDSYSVIILDEDGVEVPGGMVDGSYLNQTLNVTILHDCGGNSCWGSLQVEDKSAPLLECTTDTIPCDTSTDPFVLGFPLPGGIGNVIPIGNNTYTVTGIDLCGPNTLSYYDLVETHLCDSDVSSTIARRWTLTDASGNSSFCTDTIRTEIADIIGTTFPPNYDNFEEDALVACDNSWIALENGHPSPETTGFPSVSSCFNIHVLYTDVKIPICGEKAFKIYRTWIITDVCANLQMIDNQVIKVEDNMAPIVTCPPEFTINTDPGLCTGSTELPQPIVIFECSDYTYTVAYKKADEFGDPLDAIFTDGLSYNPFTNTYHIIGLELGTTWIVYTITDDCGNTTECFTEVTVEDNEEPVAVCDEHIVVAVGDDGIAKAHYSSFDDGSHDNCDIDNIKVRRTDFNTCDDNNFDDYVRFCCDDVGKDLMVELQVEDEAGNKNTCWVAVETQDNQRPEITCPPNLNLDCDDDLSNLDIYGTASAIDNCFAVITSQPSDNINECGTGTVFRQFTATDPGGLTASCTQQLFVNSSDPFDISDILWPPNYTFNGCVDTDADPENLQAPYNNPTWNEKPCSNIASQYEDLVFQFSEEACFKILRTWTIIDWCNFDQNNPVFGNGIWYHTQVIKINNNVSPTITQGCSNIIADGTLLPQCRKFIELSAEAFDDCTNDEKLKWHYEIDEFNDGSINYIGAANVANHALGFGTHAVEWTVRDKCGNETSCTQLVTVEDTKQPTPICLSGLTTVLMENSNNVTIWASDFDKGSFDECSPVLVSFSPNVNDISRTFDCESLNGLQSDTFDIMIYVTDQSNNQDFCNTKIVIQDNMNICGNVTTEVQVSGAIYTESNEMVDDVQVMLMADLPEFPAYQMTSDEGSYAFDNLEMYNDYQVEPSREGNYLNGVSTLDLILIQKHILGKQYLDSPYKVIAADANDSENVSAIDLVQLRKLILGFIDELPSNESWRFVDAEQEFNDELKPFPFNENIELEGLDIDAAGKNFIAVKIGDVNQSAEFSNANSAQVRNGNEDLYLFVDNSAFEAGEIIEIPIYLNEGSDLLGFQFSMDYNQESLSFEAIKSGLISMESSNYRASDNSIDVSWNQSEKISVGKDEILFYLVFKTNSTDELFNNIQIDNSKITPEAYTDESGQVKTFNMSLKLRNEIESNSEEFMLYQNIPNPFENRTTIRFDIPDSGKVTLRIFDISGKLIYEYANYFNQGANFITLDKNALKATGILYYQIETHTHTGTRKMIVIK